MAKQVLTKLIDDLTGEEADETVNFAVDGVAYEIDLSSKNASDFRTFMDRFIQAGTRTGRVGQGAQIRSHRQAQLPIPQRANRDENAAIRQWAALNGHVVSERGRIPQAVIDAYHDRHKAQSAAKALLAEQEAENAKNGAKKSVAAKKAPAKKAAVAPAKFAAAS